MGQETTYVIRMLNHAVGQQVSNSPMHLNGRMVALNASIMVFGLLSSQIDLVIESSLCILIVQRLKSYGIFVFIKEIFNSRQFGYREC